MITEQLYNLNSFQRQLVAIMTLSVCEGIPDLDWKESKEDLLKKIDWNNVLGIASVLCFSEEATHLDSALRIAQTCMMLDTSQEQKMASAIILENLTNKPAIKLAIDRGFIGQDFKSQIPLIFQLQTCKTSIENCISINDQVLNLNRFQRKVYDTYENNESISISAPTSAGKSFILCRILIQELLNGVTNIAYIVPTRALISQVENDIRILLKEYNLSNVSLSTVPQYENSPGPHLFVFTQERLHWFLSGNSDVQIDVLLIDEAQKIEDGNRGILLQQKIEDVIVRNEDVKIYFSSPFTSNPELLFVGLNNLGQKEKVDTQFIAVNQNLLYVEQIPRKVDQFKISLITIADSIDLGIILLPDRPGTSELRKLAFISTAFSSNHGGNIVYANGPAEAEDIALILDTLLKNQTVSEQLSELIKLIKKTIHKDYTLAKVLEKGIAFHYGNMPLLIRQEIERLFKEGDIKYLICTSTLLEGVNLPSKSIFIRKPTRGRGKPLTENDFWNLAGRAGRWGKEFSGNIICIDPKKWIIKPNPHKRKQQISKAIDNIASNPKDLLDYIKSGSPRDVAETRQELEFAFGYFYIKYLDGLLKKEDDFSSELHEIFEELKKSILIPDYIIKRNPGISPIAQQALFNYFEQKNQEIEKLIPVYPEDENAYLEYMRLVGRIGKTIAAYPPQLSNSRAVLLINWMQGKPLSFLIAASFKSYQNNEKYKTEKSLRKVIRETMDNVENFVRFRFAKDSSCYIDILRYFLEINNRTDLLQSIPELNLWLEFGVSQKTHLSLLSLGLTRNTVIELSEFIPNSKMSKDECLQWLKETDFKFFELSPIIINDIQKIL